MGEPMDRSVRPIRVHTGRRITYLVLAAVPLLSLAGCGIGERPLLASGDGDPAGNPAVWFLDPDKMPGPESTAVKILVGEADCSNGEGAAGNMFPPVVKITDDKVLIGVETRPRGDATCPSHPLAPLTVQLGEPFGQRTLVDANTSADEEYEITPTELYGQDVVVPPFEAEPPKTAGDADEGWPNHAMSSADVRAIECVSVYPEELGQRANAFDATITSVDLLAYKPDAGARPARVTMSVHEVLAGPERTTVTMRTWDFMLPARPREAVGVRVLAAAGPTLDLMACGYTRVFSQEDAEVWDAAFD